MSRLKITDLNKEDMISEEEMKKVFGGIIIIVGRETTSFNTSYQPLNSSLFNPTGGLIRPGSDQISTDVDLTNLDPPSTGLF